MAPLRYAAKVDPFLSLDCAPTPSTLAQYKERKESNFAIWQPCDQEFRTRLDMLPVPLESELKPGQTLRLPLWMRGPIGVGTNTVRFHVYYQNAAATGADYRAVSREITMRTVPSVTASAAWTDVTVFDDDLLRSRNVAVHLSNISKGPFLYDVRNNFLIFDPYVHIFY